MSASASAQCASRGTRANKFNSLKPVSKFTCAHESAHAFDLFLLSSRMEMLGRDADLPYNKKKSRVSTLQIAFGVLVALVLFLLYRQLSNPTVAAPPLSASEQDAQALRALLDVSKSEQTKLEGFYKNALAEAEEERQQKARIAMQFMECETKTDELETKIKELEEKLAAKEAKQ